MPTYICTNPYKNRNPGDLTESGTRMADVRAVAVCDEACGCPTPCPGGVACRCATSRGDVSMEHSRCPCGSHCSCNPCRCTKEDVAGVGRAFCKCGEGCACPTCVG